MKITPIRTPVLHPPQDDLFSVLDQSVPELEERSVIVITSKVVAIHQGRCVAAEDVDDKEALVQKEADHYLEVEKGIASRLTIKHHALISASGVDESNSHGYYTLLPEEPYEMACEIYNYLKDRDNIDDLGVIITDSHSVPFRYGALNISLGFWGIKPLRDYKGREDIFGRTFKYERNNLVDSLACATTVEMGEGDEQTPVALIQDIPSDITFADKDFRDEFLVPPGKDLYFALLEDFYKDE